LLIARLAPLPSDGKIAGIPSLCVFHNLTGLPCPGCGFSRSIVCCAHLHFSEAIAYHPLGPLMFAGLIAWSLVGFARIANAARGKHPCETPLASDRHARLREQAVRVGSALCLLLLTGVWIARLLKIIPSPP
jgi:hypothetical protein